MKRKAFFTFLCMVTVAMLLSVTVSADLGPKPSVCVSFENMGDELCYGTLLSETDSTGWHFAWDGDEKHINNDDLDLNIWRAFAEYKDEDGYYFLQQGWNVSETKEIDWTYLPPDTFKILLYYPETDTFVVSDIYESYALDSYYTVDMASVSYGSDPVRDGHIVAYRVYNYKAEIISLIARIVITILIELGIARMHDYRGKKQLALILYVNIVTQLILNLSLNIISYKFGYQAGTDWYLLLELFVFAIEAAIYCAFIDGLADQDRNIHRAVVYALIANAVSYIAGSGLAIIIPAIF